MQITKATEYAIRVILELATREDLSQPVTIAEICEKQGIPTKYFRKLIILLINAGLVRSYRGPKGGLVLARQPAEITIYDVVKVTEGEINLNVCLINEHECERQSTCVLHKVWGQAQHAMLNILKGVNFQNLRKLSA